MAGVGRSYSDDEQNFSMLNLHFCGVQKNDEKGLRLGEIFVTMKPKVGKKILIWIPRMGRERYHGTKLLSRLHVKESGG